MSFRIKVLTAFVSIGKDDEEGVMAAMTKDGVMMPLICADEERIKLVFPIAEEVSRKSGLPYRIYQFSLKTDVTSEIMEQYGKSVENSNTTGYAASED